MNEQSKSTGEGNNHQLAVSPTEAARLASIGRTKLYEAISSGALASFKIGTRRLILTSTLQAWLEAQEERVEAA